MSWVDSRSENDTTRSDDSASTSADEGPSKISDHSGAIDVIITINLLFTNAPMSTRKKLLCNLSSRTLTDSEIQLLQLGVGLVPTPVYSNFQTRIDIFMLVRNIKLKRLFGDQENAHDDSLVFRPKSTFMPCITDAHIQTFEDVLMKDIKSFEINQHKPF